MNVGDYTASDLELSNLEVLQSWIIGYRTDTDPDHNGDVPSLFENLSSNVDPKTPLGQEINTMCDRLWNLEEDDDEVYQQKLDEAIDEALELCKRIMGEE